MLAHPAPPVSYRRRRPDPSAPGPIPSTRVAGVQVGICQRIRFGETACSDGVLFINRERPLVGVVSGAGRGHTAAAAAREFCLYATHHSDDPLDEIMAGAGEALRRTAGARAALLRLDDDGAALELAVAGAIEIKTDGARRFGSRAADALLGRGAPHVPVGRHEVGETRIILLTTDGVSADADPAALLAMSAQEAAEHVVRAHRLRHADATAVVIRLG